MATTTSGLRELKRAYKRAGSDEFGLYLGAGVNMPPTSGDWPYRMYLWEDLLKELYQRNCREPAFRRLAARHKDDWPGLAETIREELGVTEEKLAELVDELVYDNNRIRGKDSQHGRLKADVLRQAPILHAAIAFAAEINRPPQPPERMNWTFRRNRRIGTVITSNYDFFFRSGYICYERLRSDWKVHTPFSKKPVKSRQRKICYLHGYLPYRKPEPEDFKRIVLTESRYDEFYKPGAFAHRELDEALTRYRLIFLGTSLSDSVLCDMLRRQKGAELRHFAIIKSSPKSDARHVASLGVCPVTVSGFSEIPELLRQVYCHGLCMPTCRDFDLTKLKYWRRLQCGKTEFLCDR